MSQNLKKQDVLIEQLLTQPTISAAADAARVNRRTAARWLADEAFRQRLREAQSQAFDRALGRICYSAGEAADILLRGIRGETVTRLQYWCAKTTLEVAALAREKDFELRIFALETQVKERQIGYSRDLDGLSDDQLKARLAGLKARTVKSFTVEELESQLTKLKGGDGDGDGQAPVLTDEQIRRLRDRLRPGDDTG